MMVSESGTAAHPRVPPRTFGYRREVLLMYVCVCGSIILPSAQWPEEPSIYYIRAFRF